MWSGRPQLDGTWGSGLDLCVPLSGGRWPSSAGSVLFGTGQWSSKIGRVSQGVAPGW